MTTTQEYHADLTHLSKSKLDVISEAPAKYKHFYLDGNPRKETKAMFEGSAAHRYLFEQHTMGDHYFVFDDSEIVAEIGGAKPRGTTRYKEWKSEQLELNTGKLELDSELLAMVQGIHASAMANPDYVDLIRPGYQSEQILYGEIDGVKVKCRLDCHVESTHTIIDLKTTTDASERKFGYSCRDYRYHVQDAFYSEIYRQNYGVKPRFIFFAVEKSAPHLNDLYELSEYDRERGTELYSADLQTYKRCIASGIWHGLTETTEVKTLIMP
jgi:exodeoxyribonuclease VIII